MTGDEFKKTKHELDEIQKVGKIGFFNYIFEDDKEKWSKQLYELLEIEPDIEMSFEDLFDFIIPEDHHILKSEREQLFTKNKPVHSEFRIKNKNNQLKYFSTNIKLIKDEEGNPKEVFGIIQDITDRKKIEEELKQSLKEKNLLIKEIHHRVKNNLQIIYSLHGLQEIFIGENPTVIKILNESKNRILSMAMIHEMLYQSKDLSSINFSDYIKNLTAQITESYVSENVDIKLETEPISLNIETAIPLGLIMNELISNSFKYAFPNNQKGEIRISLTPENGEYKLIISDNGIGLPPDMDFKNTESSLGLTLVKLLIKQLEGHIELNKNQGTKYTIKFKELKYKERI